MLTRFLVSIPTPKQTYAVEVVVIGDNVYSAFLIGWGELNKRYDLSDVNDMALVTIKQYGTKTSQSLPVYALDAAMNQQNEITLNRLMGAVEVEA